MSADIKEDRRVRKTKKALRESLAELLLEKSIHHISVRELTDKADVHRSTFYANFADIYDLYSHVEESVLQALKDIFANAHDLDSSQCVIFLLSYISENKEISRLILGHTVSNSFFNCIFDIFSNSCIAYWQKVYRVNVPIENLKVYAKFLFAGYLGVIRDWVTNDCMLPEDALIALITDIDKYFERFISDKFML